MKNGNLIIISAYFNDKILTTKNRFFRIHNISKFNTTRYCFASNICKSVHSYFANNIYVRLNLKFKIEYNAPLDRILK